MFCTPYLYYIPKASLAAIIIAAVIFMVEVRVVRPIYRSKSKYVFTLYSDFFMTHSSHNSSNVLYFARILVFPLESDLIPGLATFFACLVLPLEIGVLIGVGLNLVSILYHAARPKLLIEVHKVGS